MNPSDVRAMAYRIAKKWQQRPPEKSKPTHRKLGPGESSSQEIPDPPVALQDIKEKDNNGTAFD